MSDAATWLRSVGSAGLSCVGFGASVVRSFMFGIRVIRFGALFRVC